MTDINALKQEAFDVVRAIYDVHNELGPGLNESCYQEGLQVELEKKKIPYVRERSFHPHYRGVPLETTFSCGFHL